MEKSQTNTGGDYREKSWKQHQYACFYSRVFLSARFPIGCALPCPDSGDVGFQVSREDFLAASFVFPIVDLELFSESIKGTKFLLKHLRPKDNQRHKVRGTKGTTLPNYLCLYPTYLDPPTHRHVGSSGFCWTHGALHRRLVSYNSTLNGRYFATGRCEEKAPVPQEGLELSSKPSSGTFFTSKCYYLGETAAQYGSESSADYLPANPLDTRLELYRLHIVDIHKM